jgi:predicted ATPase/class 3 adenylate cyclase
MPDRPSGTVTFLFTDIEGSTKLWQQHPDAMPGALARHHALLNEAVATHGGYVFQIIGDAFCAAFSTATDGLGAALATQRALRDATWGETGAIRVRMALHTGAAEVRAGEFTSGEYVSGLTLSRAARLLSAGHGEQILLSLPTAELVRDQLPSDVSLRDLDAHRLKDLIRPEHIYQVVVPDLRSEFLPLKTLDTHPNNLPIQLTSFIGREQEMARVKELLEGARLLSLTGSGGAGKTRLSLQVAADLIDEFPDGVWFIELAPLTDPALIPQTVASLLGLREEAGRPVMTMLSDYLRAKSTLLLLDNCEHLIDACAKFADTILHAAPKVKLLATSREALGIAGEAAYRVPSLSLPPVQLATSNFQTLTQYESVRLFIDRALAVQPDFSVTSANAPALAQICHRLDGIPLALELAAARVKSLSVEQIAARLDDRFRLLTGGSRTALPRQQTLRAAIDWSFSLLAEEERVLLRRLSVFAGGWTLEAAQAVCSCDPICADDVLDLLARLVDKSLVIFEQRDSEARFRMMETIRQYARDRLLESTEAETIRDRHLDFFMAFAEEVEPKLRGPEQMQWLDRLDLEHDNLRAALEWSLGAGRVEKGLRLGAALAWFWERRGYMSEGQAHLTAILCMAEGMADTSARARALHAAGRLAQRQGDLVPARQLLEQSHAMARTLGDKWTQMLSLHNLGNVLNDERGEIAMERSLHEESLNLARELGNDWGITWALMGLGHVAIRESDYTAARSYFEESLKIRRRLGDKWGIARSLNELGEIAQREGDYASAQKFYTESLTIHRELGHKSHEPRVLFNLGSTALSQNDYGRAQTLFVQCLRLSREQGRRTFMIGCLVCLAQVAAVFGQAEKAARLFGASDAQDEARGRLLNPADRKEHVAAVRAQLGEAPFNAAWAEGRAMTLEQAAELAMS